MKVEVRITKNFKRKAKKLIKKYASLSKEKINKLQTQINQTDKEIDKMVYELYELTEQEIKIICEN